MKENERINIRQLCIFYFLYSIAMKIMTLPSLLTQGSGNLAWLSALIGVAVEVALVFVATILLRKLAPENKGFRVLCFLFVPVILVEIVMTSVQIYNMAYTDLFTDLSIFIFILTLILLGSFFITRKPRSFFRAGEILWLFFALGLVIAIIPTLYNLKVDWQALIQGDYRQIVPTALGNLLFFESAIFIFIFGSETQKTARELRRINLTAVACAVGFALFMVLFIILFGPLAPQKTTAIVDVTTAAQFITTEGALDWLIATATLTVLILRFGIQLVALATLVKRGLGRHD